MSKMKFDVEETIEGIHRHYMSLIRQLKHPSMGIATLQNVCEIGIGYQSVAGKLSSDIGPIVFVREKVPSRDLNPAEQVPIIVSIDGEYTRVDVQEITDASQAQNGPGCIPGGGKHMVSPQIDEHRPVPGGAMIAPVDPQTGKSLGNGGTSGVRVQREANGNTEYFMLTAKHVIDAGQEVSQPFDPNPQHNGKIIGQYVEGDSDLDASIFQGESDYTSHILCLGEPKKSISPIVGMKVKKSGMTTGVTGSTILSLTESSFEVANSQSDYPGTMVGPFFAFAGDSGSATLLGSASDPGDFGDAINAFLQAGAALSGVSAKILASGLTNRVLGIVVTGQFGKKSESKKMKSIENAFNVQVAT